MSFLHPEFLYYMLIPLFILFGLLFTQKEVHEHFFSQSVMEKLRVRADTLTLKARNALFLLMAFFMIIALAEPVIKGEKIEVKAKSSDIMIAMDISDSMLATDIYPNRLEASKQKVLNLLEENINERIGLVAFAKNSYLVSPLSFDKGAVSFLLKKLETSYITEKGTDFLSLLDTVGKIREKQKKKYLFILTDGADKKDFSKEIDKAKKYGITVFILGMGTKKGAPIKLKDGTFIKYRGDIVISRLNENIADLATKTGGVYIEATTSSADIKRMLQEIRGITDKKELKSEEIRMNKPLFYYPLAVAMLIFLIATSSLKRKRNVNAAVILALFVYALQPSQSKASILDFLELGKAKEAYENGEFKESGDIYEKYADENLNNEAYFNAANANYKQKKYKEAVELYKKAKFTDKDKIAKNLSNMGNAYAKEASTDSLQKAVKAYEESLKIKKDKDTQDNLEEVKKFLEKQKQDQKKNRDNKQDKKDKQQEASKDKNSKQNDKDQDSKDTKNKESDKKERSEDKKDSSKDSDEMKNEKDKQDSKSDNNQTKAQNKKNELKKLEKNDTNGSKSASNMQSSRSKEKMSDAEEKKWLEQLNSSDNTYLYRLNPQERQNDSFDEKPW